MNNLLHIVLSLVIICEREENVGGWRALLTRQSQCWGGARPTTRVPGYAAPGTVQCVICSDDKHDVVKLSCCKNKICKECDKRCENCPFCRSTQRFWIETEDEPQESSNSGNTIPTREQENCIICGVDRDDIVKLSCCENLICRKCDDRCQKCRFCRRTQRFWIGHNMPPGSMLVLLRKDIQLSGVDRKGCYEITYAMNDSFGNEVRYDAYIPYTIVGLHTLLLLILAFYRQLTFSYSPTKTLGWVKWSGIPHKTSLQAGNRFGYPDSRYIEHLTSILADHRISHDNLRTGDRCQLEVWDQQLVSEGYLRICS